MKLDLVEVNLQKEKSHALDYCRRIDHSVATWLSRLEYQPEFSENRQLDSHPARHCRHSRYFEFVGNRELVALTNCAQPKGRSVSPPLYTQVNVTQRKIITTFLITISTILLRLSIVGIMLICSHPSARRKYHDSFRNEQPDTAHLFGH
jgi:hypothetical protein